MVVRENQMVSSEYLHKAKLWLDEHTERCPPKGETSA
jgi:hypothetical protein